MNDFIHANIHQFKTHLSRYIRILENKEAKAIVVERHGKPVCFLVLCDKNNKKKN